MNVIDRLERKSVRTETGCREWQGAANPQGFGHININHKVTNVARVAYGLLVARIPKGREIHCVYGNRRCWEPDHLVAVTHGMTHLGLTYQKAAA